QSDLVFFGATVTYAYVNGGREERTIQIVGVDEVDTKRGHVSWISPIARALLKKRNGDVATLATPTGDQEIEILKVRYSPQACGSAAPARPPSPDGRSAEVRRLAGASNS